MNLRRALRLCAMLLLLMLPCLCAAAEGLPMEEQAADTVAPTISGVRDRTIFTGDPLDLGDVRVTDESDPAPLLIIDEGDLDLSRPGEYVVTYTARDSAGNSVSAQAKITIVDDLTPPEIFGVQDHDIFIGDSVDYISSVYAVDNRDGEVRVLVDDSQVDLLSPKKAVVTYYAVDSIGNIATAYAKIRTMYDTTPPQITGAQDISVQLGESPSYRAGVSVTDDRDERVALQIDNSQVDLNVVGAYKVTYSATDSSGNTGTQTITVRVTEKYLDDDDVELLWPLVDEVLAEIVTDEMTPMEKGFKIYGWTKRNIRYSGYSDKSHWVTGAYDGLTKRRGDCFTYFSVSKALLERAGIPNIDVVKSDTRYSEHFWSLVDVGGGWYHFDSCHLSGGGDNFYLVTDAELARWDKQHRNAHPFDASLYPERATESVQHRLHYGRYTVSD
ncbi:MAG: transglutaminase domain-containing protein [Eubacteriales bacterium]|nr:transglutaminase domain-containing protein [Eubacteriales bacterium]